MPEEQRSCQHSTESAHAVRIKFEAGRRACVRVARTSGPRLRTRGVRKAARGARPHRRAPARPRQERLSCSAVAQLLMSHDEREAARADHGHGATRHNVARRSGGAWPVLLHVECSAFPAAAPDGGGSTAVPNLPHAV
jgi:hypothetical protein